MLKLGITGGISSGKTTASIYLNSKHDKAYLFNADKESKRHLKSSHSLQKKIINTFGNDVLKNNKLDLTLLANKAFSNDTNHKILNGIMWPEIHYLITKKFDEIIETNCNLFLVDAALIFEANIESFFDKTLLITANEKIRVERAVKRKNISLESIQNRISLQMPDSLKKKKAHNTINNNLSIDSFYKKLDKFYTSLKI